jgi:hypothetical protein
MDYKHKLHISEGNFTIFYNDGRSRVRVPSSPREVRRCLVETEYTSFQMLFDERFNELDFVYNDKPNDPFSYVNKSVEYLKEKFKELKSTDFRYKSGDGYEGSKTLYLEDFITYLKSENREIIINNILC